MNERDIHRLTAALKNSGADDVSVEDGRHHMLFFSVGGNKANPIVISKTPSDRHARVKVAADIRREFKKLGFAPPTVAALGAVVGAAYTGYLAKILTYGAHAKALRRESIWALLNEWDKDGEKSV